MTTPGTTAAPSVPPESFEGFVAYLAKLNQRLEPEQEPFVKALFASGGEWRHLAHKLFSYGSVLDLEASLSAPHRFGDLPPAAFDPGPADVDDRDRSAPAADSGNGGSRMVVLELLRDGEDKVRRPPRAGFAVVLAAWIVAAAAFLLLKAIPGKRNRRAARALWKTAKERRMGFRIRLHNRRPQRCGPVCRLAYIAVDRRINDVFTSRERPQDIEVLQQSNEIRRAEWEMQCLFCQTENFEGFVAFLANRKQRLELAGERLVKVLFASGCEWRRLSRKLVNYGIAIDREASLSAARKVFDDGPIVDQKPAEKVGLVDVDPGPVDVNDPERPVPDAVSGNDDRQVVVLELIGCDVNDQFLPPQPRVAFCSALAAYVVKAAASLLLQVMREKQSRLAARALWKTPQGCRTGFRIRLHNRIPERRGQLCQLVHVWIHHGIDDLFISKERPLSVKAIRQDNERRRSELDSKQS